MAKIEFKHDLTNIKENLREFGGKVDWAIKMVIDRRATDGQADMKTNAPWTDRTTAARNGLHTTTIHEKNTHKIIFAHTVYYGIWLEIANSGRYEIIMPTVRKQGNILMAELEDLFGDLQAGRGRR